MVFLSYLQANDMSTPKAVENSINAVKARIAGRMFAGDLMELIQEEFKSLEGQHNVDFCESLLQELTKLVPKKKQQVARKTSELQRAQRFQLQFGEHAGCTLGTVVKTESGPGYLKWLLGSSLTLCRHLTVLEEEGYLGTV